MPLGSISNTTKPLGTDFTENTSILKILYNTLKKETTVTVLYCITASASLILLGFPRRGSCYAVGTHIALLLEKI